MNINETELRKKLNTCNWEASWTWAARITQKSLRKTAARPLDFSQEILVSVSGTGHRALVFTDFWKLWRQTTTRSIKSSFTIGSRKTSHRVFRPETSTQQHHFLHLQSSMTCIMIRSSRSFALTGLTGLWTAFHVKEGGFQHVTSANGDRQGVRLNENEMWIDTLFMTDFSSTRWDRSQKWGVDQWGNPSGPHAHQISLWHKNRSFLSWMDIQWK